LGDKGVRWVWSGRAAPSLSLPHEGGGKRLVGEVRRRAQDWRIKWRRLLRVGFRCGQRTGKGRASGTSPGPIARRCKPEGKGLSAGAVG